MKLFIFIIYFLGIFWGLLSVMAFLSGEVVASISLVSAMIIHIACAKSLQILNR